MLSEQMVESLLVSGVAGAGLVLTTLTLGVLKSEELLKVRAKALNKTTAELKAESKKPQVETPRLVALANQIMSLRNLPTYLGTFVFLSFICFVISSLLAVLWIAESASVDPSVLPQQTGQFDPYLVGIFAAGVISFLVMGLFMIADLESYLKLRYDDLQKEKK